MRKVMSIAVAVAAVSLMMGCSTVRRRETDEVCGEWRDSAGDVWRIRADGAYYAAAVAPSQPSEGVWKFVDGECITLKQTNPGNPITYRLQMTDEGRTLSGSWSGSGYSGTLTLRRTGLIGSGTGGEPEPKPGRKAERQPEPKPEWKSERKPNIPEPERKAKVQALVKQLADESLENRQAAYTELLDTFVRKRDIPDLHKEIARNADPKIRKSLWELITFLKARWRLPGKGWTLSIFECHRRYEREFEYLGCDLAIVSQGGWTGEYFLTLHIDILDVPIENRAGVIDLIYTLEPESLFLWGPWSNITFLGTLGNLERLDLQFSEVTDLTPLKGLPRLERLNLQNAKVTDLTPLKGLGKLKSLNLQNTKVTDLTALKGMPHLEGLCLQNTQVTDLTPLKGLPKLERLDLQNTKVTDLTPLEGMPDLQIQKGGVVVCP